MDEKPEGQLLRAVKELHYWQYGPNPTNFTSMLYLMFQKADSLNKVRLTIAFPFEALAYKEWCESTSQDEFFEKYGLKSFRMLYNQHSVLDESSG